jgi:hypothetical protein
VQNNPVNFFDPFGLRAPDGFIYKKPWDNILGPPDPVGPAFGASLAYGIAAFWDWLWNDPYFEARSKRKKTDPPWVDDFVQHNPGKFPDGKCKPCKDNSPKWTNPGQENCSGHQIVYYQDPVTCECYPKRTHE